MIQIKLVASDTEALVVSDLAHTIWKEHYTSILGENQVAYMLNTFQTVAAIQSQIDSGVLYYCIEFHKKAVGYMAFYKKIDRLYISKIYVLREARGKSIGTTAMQFIEKKGKEMGCFCVSLDVNIDNTSAIQSYQKMGFVKKGEMAEEIGEGHIMEGFVMEKPLVY